MIRDRSREQAVANTATAAAQKKAEQEAKELKELKSKIRNLIENYRANHPTIGIDYAKTESNQAKLRGVLAEKVGGRASDSLDQLLTRVTLQNGKDALKAVSEAYYKMS